jgi:hypothetical protein
VHTMLLFVFWAFNKKTLSLHPGQSRKMTNLTLQQKYLLNNPNKKNSSRLLMEKQLQQQCHLLFQARKNKKREFSC